MKYEYKVTIARVTDFEEPAQLSEPVRPEGEGWRIISTFIEPLKRMQRNPDRSINAFPIVPCFMWTWEREAK